MSAFLRSSRAFAIAGALSVVALFAVPLFFGLDGWDQRNDEAIYSYAVDRILETGDWLTPRSIPTDDPFLEKPPLKFWMVAGGMATGLLPRDDAGMRVLDAVFGGLAFLYVYALGRRMAGPIAGIVAAFVLFEFEPLIFNHGIRGNHMEAPLILAYCGGMYHVVCWIEGDARGRLHAWAVLGFFAFAFLTKFVAALFLPVIGVAAFALSRPASSRARPSWRNWIAPVAGAVVLIAPWFVYQTIHSGRALFETMFGAHVFTRFLGTLAVTHLQPWYHYFTQTWIELGYSESRIIMLLGLAALMVEAVWRRNWLARVCLAWWLIPFAIMSMGTSKLFYYAYPFLPPLALGAGLAASRIVEIAGGRIDRIQVPRWRPLAILGGAALAIALWTLVAGSVDLEIGTVRLFKNSSVLRPAVLGAALWMLVGLGGVVRKIASVCVVVLLLPIGLYARRVDRLSSIDHPLRTARDCAMAVQQSGTPVGRGVLSASGDLHHAFFYYLRRLGPFVWPDRMQPDDLGRRLEVAGEQTPIILSATDYVRLGGRLTRVQPDAPGSPSLSAAESMRFEHGVPGGIVIGDLVVILFPGPFASCAAPVARAGAIELKPVVMKAR